MEGGILLQELGGDHSVRTLRVLICCLITQAYSFQEPGLEAKLAQDLADETTRESAIRGVQEQGTPSIARLIQLGNDPPQGVNHHRLLIGLADLFGRLKAEEAIPFLADNITLQRYNDMNTWTRTDAVVEGRLPAAHALIQIGGPAVNPLARAYWKPTTFDERNAIMFTLSKIATPEAEEFFRVAISAMRLQMEWAEAGRKKASPMKTRGNDPLH
jgi:hypothetical protein